MVDSEVRFVYQLVSTEVSPERNQISSEREESSKMDVGRLEGWAISAKAYVFHDQHVAHPKYMYTFIYTHLLPSVNELFIPH